jgi:hypothetical protein
VFSLAPSGRDPVEQSASEVLAAEHRILEACPRALRHPGHGRPQTRGEAGRRSDRAAQTDRLGLGQRPMNLENDYCSQSRARLHTFHGNHPTVK